MQLENKVAAVTGSSLGIGRAIAVAFGREGASVVINYRSHPEEGQEAVEEIQKSGGQAISVQADVSEPDGVRNLIQQTVEEFGRLDVMVNNAGVGVAGTAITTTEEEYERVMDVCVRGTFLGMKHAIPAIKDAGGGSVIHMSSVAALVGLVDRAVYSAAKGAIYSMTRASAIDHVGEGVRVNCIAPGTVDTPWVARITSGYDDPEEARANMRARQPHGRLVTPEEIAAMAAYLASEEAGSIVGACMAVDGGVTAR